MRPQEELLMCFDIKEDGWTQHFAADMNELHYGQYAEEKAAAAAARKQAKHDEMKNE